MNPSTPFFIHQFIGDEDEFVFRQRLLHVICISGALGTAFIALVHLSIGLYFTALSMGLLCILLLSSLALSRYFRLSALGITLFGLSSLCILFYTYLNTGGIDGEAIYGLLTLYLSMIIICRPQMRIMLSLIFAIVLVSLLVIEQFYPQHISNYSAPQLSGGVEVLSFGSVFISIAFICYNWAVFMWEEYKEKSQVAQVQLKKIENQNRIIQEKVTELEETNKQKDRLFSIIGHDLRNPLASIEGYLDALDHGLDKEDQVNIKNQLLRLVQNSSGLLENLVKWAKKDTQAKIEELNAKDIALKAIATLKPIAYNKNITISVLMDEDDARVVADSNMLEMVIRNLVSNAIKFTNEGGWIKIRAYTHSEYISLEVEDNGVGMDESQRQRIFTPDRMIGTGTASEKGVGLGLLLCKEFVEKMNGSISCSSQKGKGSNFKITLPIPNANGNVEAEPAEAFS